MNGAALAAGLALVLLEVGLAVPLQFGSVSLALPLACWLCWLWGPARAAVGVALALLLRRRGWREFLCEFLPAALLCLALAFLESPLESPLLLVLLLLASVPLQLGLRLALGPKSLKHTEWIDLSWEVIGLALLGPLALGLAKHWPPGLLALPVLLMGLLGSARRQRTIQQWRSRGVEMSRVQASSASAQEQEARAEAFQMVEALSLQCHTRQQAVEAMLNLMIQRFPGCYCAFQSGGQLLARRGIEAPEQGHRMHWNLPPDSALLVSFRSPLPPAAQHSLGVFVRCGAVMLERADFQEGLLRSLQTLRFLLAASQEMAPGLPADSLRELACQVAQRLTEGRALHFCARGTLQVSDGLPLAAHQQEALQLLEQLLHNALQRGQQQAQLTQSSKLAAIGQLAAGVAHELNTPLSSVTLLLAGARQSLQSRPERAERNLEQTLKAVEQMKSIVGKLLYYGRESGQGRRQVDLASIVQDTLELTAYSLKANRVAVEWQPQTVFVEVDPGEIQQVLSNLLINASLAVEPGPGVVRIGLGLEGSQAVLLVEDSGPGVDAEIAERIFEPFFTTRQVGQGTGLGLSISRQIAEQNGGSLSFLGGSRFQLRLPLCSKAVNAS